MSSQTRMSRFCEMTFNNCARLEASIAAPQIHATGIDSYRRTTVIDRQPTLPAASFARIVTILSPTKRGTSAVDHAVVPVARPDAPVEVVQRTSTTPMLSFA